jgi:hypothetical protein
MKKLLTTILLCISLSSFSQTQKGDFVITPIVGKSNFTNNSGDNFKYFSVQLPVSIHYYLSDKFAVGLNTEFRYYKAETFPINTGVTYTRQKNWDLFIKPELQYNFLSTRFTPFIRANYLGFVWLNHANIYYENAVSVPKNIDVTETNFFNGLSLKSFSVDFGITYYIKQRFGLQLSLATVYNQTDKIKAQFNLPYNIGLQFIINNPRSEIQSPR